MTSMNTVTVSAYRKKENSRSSRTSSPERYPSCTFCVAPCAVKFVPRPSAVVHLVAL